MSLTSFPVKSSQSFLSVCVGGVGRKVNNIGKYYSQRNLQQPLVIKDSKNVIGPLTIHIKQKIKTKVVKNCSGQVLLLDFGAQPRTNFDVEFLGLQSCT